MRVISLLIIEYCIIIEIINRVFQVKLINFHFILHEINNLVKDSIIKFLINLSIFLLFCPASVSFPYEIYLLLDS